VKWYEFMICIGVIVIFRGSEFVVTANMPSERAALFAKQRREFNKREWVLQLVSRCFFIISLITGILVGKQIWDDLLLMTMSGLCIIAAAVFECLRRSDELAFLMRQFADYRRLIINMIIIEDCCILVGLFLIVLLKTHS